MAENTEGQNTGAAATAGGVRKNATLTAAFRDNKFSNEVLKMPKIYIKEKSTIETTTEDQGKALAGCEDCSKVDKDSADLVRDELIAQDCGVGEWTQAWAWIDAPANQNQLVIPSARSLNDAVDKTRRCGGDPNRVWFSSSPVLHVPLTLGATFNLACDGAAKFEAMLSLQVCRASDQFCKPINKDCANEN